MRRRWIIGVALLGLTGCTPGIANDMLAGAIGGSLGGPIGGLAAVSANQPAWQYQTNQQPAYDPFAAVAASNQQLIQQQNWQTLNSAYFVQHHVGLIPQD